MKKLLFLFFIATISYSQTYCDIIYNDGSPTNCTNLSEVEKITFNENSLIFELTDNSTVSKDMATIDTITFSVTDDGNPLPVELTNFTAHVYSNEVRLNWITVSEVNNYGFQVEKLKVVSHDYNDWNKIGFVEGYGNTNSPKEYSFIDDSISNNSIYKYRLKQIDIDGGIEYSNEVEVEIEAQPYNFKLFQNYPNPFNPLTTFSYNLSKGSHTTLIVYDILGNRVAKLVDKKQQAGKHQINFNAKNLTAGVYIVELKSAGKIALLKILLMK